jgi:hypothetical protein
MDSVPHSMNRKYMRDYTQKEKGVNGEDGDRKTDHWVQEKYCKEYSVQLEENPKSAYDWNNTLQNNSSFLKLCKSHVSRN